VPDNTLYFCSLSDKVFEELQELFRDSFQLTLCPFVPWDTQSSHPPSAPQVGGSSAPAALPPGTDPLTIGREFLTWLWFFSEARGGLVRFPDLGEFSVMVEGSLTFFLEGAGAHEIVLRRGFPLLSAEAIAARGLRLAGWVANCVDPQMARRAENIAALRTRLSAPLLGQVPRLASGRPAAAAAFLDLPPGA